MKEAPKRWPYRGRKLSYRAAVEIQERLRDRVLKRWKGPAPRTVAGVDISIKDGRASAAVVVLAFPSMEYVTDATATRPADFPYIPGLLAFREVPVALKAFAKLDQRPDLLMVDGHGLAHPRRFGIACFLGVELDLPAIGIGKSLLVGEHRQPGARRSSQTQLRHEGEVIGKALRTRDGVNPVYVSIGHRIDLESAVRFTLRCSKGYRLPEPIRAAHNRAGSAAAAP